MNIISTSMYLPLYGSFIGERQTHQESNKVSSDKMRLEHFGLCLCGRTFRIICTWLSHQLIFDRSAVLHTVSCTTTSASQRKLISKRSVEAVLKSEEPMRAYAGLRCRACFIITTLHSAINLFFSKPSTSCRRVTAFVLWQQRNARL